MRKYFLDNLRYSIVLSVILYHVVYLFNSVGVITNVDIPGIPALDAVLYVLYPWFMITLFVISGICARYALQRQSNRDYLKSKIRRQLIPSVAVVFLIGWTSGWVTGQYADMFGINSDSIPGFVKYLIWSLSGIGAVWFLHQLLLAEAILVLLRKADRKDRLWQLGGKVTLPVLGLLVFALWGSAQIINTPVIEVYRNGIYIFAFLTGYCIFSHERVQEMLAGYAPALLGCGALLGVAYTVRFWGENYAAMDNLKSFLTNAYAWVATLAALGAGKRWADREVPFTRYMAARSFGFYVLHYPVLALGAWAMDRLLHLPVPAMYLLLPVLAAVILPPLVDTIRRIPVLNILILGEK